jgi:hypothetical protein
MLQAAVTRARHRSWRLVARLALAVAALAGFVLTALEYATPDSDDRAVVPVAVPMAQPEPSPGAADAPSIDEPIGYLAAASDAPVIAVASEHHVWISRDDGETFAPALHDPRAELYDLTVDPSGRVHAMWGENKIWRSPGGRGGVDTIEFVLGIAEVDGRERWRPTHDVLAAPLDTRAGWIVGTGWPVIGRDSGDTWTRVPASDRWHVWRASIDDHHTARFFASRIDAPESCENCARGLSLLVSRDGRSLRRVWSMLDRKEISTDQFPTNVIACAGFAGSTLYLVAREPKGARLIAVSGDGKLLPKPPLPEGLAADVTCTIAGNDRAAFMALGDDIMRIDTDELRVAPRGAITPQAPGDRDDLAVDAHGHLLYVANACVWRYAEAGVRYPDKVVCGPHR